jgi:hypothetical protein
MSDSGDEQMNVELIGNEINRTVKLAMDSGEATSPEEARRIFERYRLCLNVGSDVAKSPTLQACLLTAVNTGRRCFLGGVEVVGCPDADLLIRWRDCHTLSEAVADLQGSLVQRTPSNVPQIVIGDTDNLDGESEFAVRATFDGWLGGVTPLDELKRLNERHEFTPSGVMAGALAVSEAFQFIRGRNAQAGRRSVGLSLWQPDSATDWLDNQDVGPKLEWLPARLWLIGLGHLGQAYLWTLGFLPYIEPSDVQLILQDFDTLVPANDSTSPLTDYSQIDRKKTRAMAEWAEQRGFTTRIVERRFASNFQIEPEEPQVALCGVDNAAARAALEDAGFAQIIEAGLGRGNEEYLAFQMHCFPAYKSARHRWGANSSGLIAPSSLIGNPAYQSLATSGLDRCGLTMLANRAVGASFVGTFTSTIVIAELLRMTMGGPRYEVIDGSLRSPDRLNVIASKPSDLPFNPGVARARDDSVKENLAA